MKNDNSGYKRDKRNYFSLDEYEDRQLYKITCQENISKSEMVRKALNYYIDNNYPYFQNLTEYSNTHYEFNE